MQKISGYWQQRFAISRSLWFCFFLPSCISLSIKTELRTYSIQDQRSNSFYSEGTFEHHCFNFNNGQRNYVRGTYGSYGYFEGAVDRNNPLLFLINWYETSLATVNGVSGSALLNYSSTWNSVSGISWSSGSSDLNDSYHSWSSNNGTVLADDSSTSGSDLLLTKCLYPGANYETPRVSISILKDKSITSASSDGTNSFCQVPAGGFSLWFGTYLYHYTLDKDGVKGTETGNYGVNSLSFLLKSGMGVVGEWKAVTGPYAGDHGTNLYVILSTTSAQVLVVGFYCFLDSNSQRTQCESEYYEVLTDKTTRAYQDGVSACPSFYRQDDSLAPLYAFISEGYQHLLHCNTDRHGGETVAWIIAAIFILFSLILLLTFLYIFLRASTPKNATVSPYQ
jgi:hypothetical protein